MSSLLTALGLVFLAELGDKTQLVVLTMGAGRRLGRTLLGLLATIAVLQALAVALGSVVAAAVPDDVLGVASGVIFLGFGAWAWRAGDDHDDEGPPGSLASFLLAFFVAELGDKSSLATAVLATTNDPVATWAGATLGFFAATAVSLAAGTWLRRRIAPTTMQRVGAIAFLVVGLVTIVAALTT